MGLFYCVELGTPKRSGMNAVSEGGPLRRSVLAVTDGPAECNRSTASKAPTMADPKAMRMFPAFMAIPSFYISTS
jgi:hypothetical protein